MNRSPGMLRKSPYSHTSSQGSAFSPYALLLLILTIGFAGAPVLPLPAEALSTDDPAPEETTGDKGADIELLIESLSSSDYEKREGANRDLLKVGEIALPSLRKALESDDAEVRRRATALIDAISKSSKEIVEENDRFEVIRKRLEFPGDRSQRPSLDRELGDLRLRLEELLEREKERAPLGKESLRDRIRSLGGGFPPEFDPDRFDDRIAALRERIDRQWRDLPRLEGLFPEGLEGFGSGTGSGWGSSRVQIWRDGETLFDSATSLNFSDLPALGVVIESIHPSLRAHLPIGQGPDGEPQGVLIGKVLPGTLAEECGLKRFDVLLTAGGIPVTGVGTLREQIAAHAGENLELGIIRGGQPRSMTVPIASGSSVPSSSVPSSPGVKDGEF